MKRNLDLIREILLKVESYPNVMSIPSKDIKLDGYSDDMINYNIKLLFQTGLIEGIDATSKGSVQWHSLNLTWEGHEFLDKIKNESIWNQAKRKTMISLVVFPLRY